jgi:hypothetical protein
MLLTIIVPESGVWGVYWNHTINPKATATNNAAAKTRTTINDKVPSIR